MTHNQLHRIWQPAGNSPSQIITLDTLNGKVPENYYIGCEMDVKIHEVKISEYSACHNMAQSTLCKNLILEKWQVNLKRD